MKFDEINVLEKELIQKLELRYEPIAVRYAKSEDEIPSNAFRPFKDKGQHYAMCQALTLVKNEGIVIALSKEDQWCWKPPIGAGMVKVEEGTEAWDIAIKNCGVNDPQKAAQNFRELPKLEYGSCKSILIAPLSKTTFNPDVILIYCHKATQINWLVGAQKYDSGERVLTDIDYIDSCLWSTIPTIKTHQMKVTFPDPGELDRAGCPEDEVIVSIHADDYERVFKNAIMKYDKQRKRLKKEDGTPKMKSEMVPDFPRPEFYTKLYRLWGMDDSGNVIWTEKDR